MVVPFGMRAVWNGTVLAESDETLVVAGRDGASRS
jgi:hypothetical protein